MRRHSRPVETGHSASPTRERGGLPDFPLIENAAGPLAKRHGGLFFAGHVIDSTKMDDGYFGACGLGGQRSATRSSAGGKVSWRGVRVGGVRRRRNEVSGQAGRDRVITGAQKSM